MLLSPLVLGFFDDIELGVSPIGRRAAARFETVTLLLVDVGRVDDGECGGLTVLFMDTPSAGLVCTGEDV